MASTKPTIPEQRKRGYESPTEEDEENETALTGELERKARALRISETGTTATAVPYPQAGFRRRKVQALDQWESFPEFGESNDIDPEVEEICYVLDGGAPGGELEQYVTGRKIENIRRALTFAFNGLNEAIIESIDFLMEEAISLDVDLDEEQFYGLRSDLFHERNETAFIASLPQLGMQEAVQIVLQGRCEIAWAKDNRDRLVDHVEEVKALGEVNGAHNLHFQFYPRSAEIELLGDERRGHVRAATSGHDTPPSDGATSGMRSPVKRRRPGKVDDVEMSD